MKSLLMGLIFVLSFSAFAERCFVKETGSIFSERYESCEECLVEKENCSTYCRAPLYTCWVKDVVTDWRQFSGTHSDRRTATEMAFQECRDFASICEFIGCGRRNHTTSVTQCQSL